LTIQVHSTNQQQVTIMLAHRVKIYQCAHLIQKEIKHANMIIINHSGHLNPSQIIKREENDAGNMIVHTTNLLHDNSNRPLGARTNVLSSCIL